MFNSLNTLCYLFCFRIHCTENDDLVLSVYKLNYYHFATLLQYLALNFYIKLNYTKFCILI